MDLQQWIEAIVAIISGLAVCIPLVLELVKYVKAAVKEKNYNELVKLALPLMVEAEDLFENGSDKKNYVMAAIEEAAKTINYDYNDEAKAKISALIDSVCDVTKVVNK